MIDNKRLYKLIGKRLYELRMAKSPTLSQKELADLIGVERTSISNIESGNQRATLAFLYQVSERLSVNLSELLPSVDEVALRRVQTGKSTTIVPPKAAQVIRNLSENESDSD